MFTVVKPFSVSFKDSKTSRILEKSVPIGTKIIGFDPMALDKILIEFKSPVRIIDNTGPEKRWVDFETNIGYAPKSSINNFIVG